MSYYDDEPKFGDGSDDDEETTTSSSASDIEDENENKNENENEELEDEEDELDEVDDEDEVDEEDEDDDEMEGGDPDSDVEIEEEVEEVDKKPKRVKKVPSKNVYKKPIDYIEEDDENNDDDGEQYLQKFDQSINENYILNFHPESVLQNYDEILSMIKVVRDSNGIIVDKLHRTIPFLTKYEKARILGQRAKQINSGSTPFVKVPENVIDGYLIAEMELKEKKIPFIIRRPLPNGGSEYWSLKDLENITF
jgi:DNA-directed RNA polymerase I, II, and III subunit RPABC2